MPPPRPFTHPRFGEIKCLRAIQPVAAGEELTCHYDYQVCESSTCHPKQRQQVLGNKESACLG